MWPGWVEDHFLLFYITVITRSCLPHTHKLISLLRKKGRSISFEVFFNFLIKSLLRVFVLRERCWCTDHPHKGNKAPALWIWVLQHHDPDRAFTGWRLTPQVTVTEFSSWSQRLFIHQQQQFIHLAKKWAELNGCSEMTETPEKWIFICEAASFYLH